MTAKHGVTRRYQGKLYGSNQADTQKTKTEAKGKRGPGTKNVHALAEGHASRRVCLCISSTQWRQKGQGNGWQTEGHGRQAGSAGRVLYVTQGWLSRAGGRVQGDTSKRCGREPLPEGMDSTVRPAGIQGHSLQGTGSDQGRVHKLPAVTSARNHFRMSYRRVRILARAMDSDSEVLNTFARSNCYTQAAVYALNHSRGGEFLGYRYFPAQGVPY